MALSHQASLSSHVTVVQAQYTKQGILSATLAEHDQANGGLGQKISCLGPETELHRPPIADRGLVIPAVTGLVPSLTTRNMTPGGQADGFNGPQSVLDPISRQIFERTHTSYGTAISNGAMGSVDESRLNRQSTAGTLAEVDTLRRSDSVLSGKGTKEKKKGVSFLSRIMGTKKRDETSEAQDTVSEINDLRPLGVDAEVFSQPIGFVPRYPPPPKYIGVKAQNRKTRDFDRLFLAQILSEGAPRSRKGSVDEVDSKIRSINDQPTVPPPNSTRTVNNAVWAAEFSKDGQYLAVGGQDKKLKVWRVISSKEDRDHEDNPIESTTMDGKKVKLNAPIFKQELVREYEGHSSAILDLSWSKNNFLLSSSMDKTVRLYHISRAECLCAFKHNDFVPSIQFHPRDDRFFLAGSLDSKIRLWSIPDKNVAYWAHATDMVTAVAFTPDGKTAIAGTLNGICTLYDADGLKAHSQIHVRSNRGKNAKGSKITGIDTISIPRPHAQPDVKILITSNDSRIRMYNLRDKSLEIKFRGNENSSSQIRASFSDDGKFVICGSEDKKVYIWPTGPLERLDSDKRPMEIFEAHNAIVTSALIMPTRARRLLAQSGDPLYDLCNPPPVRLLSRTDSVLSSRAPTQHSGSEDPKHSMQESDTANQAEASPQYLARHDHKGGLIVVTADYTGQIKAFRQDCAYQKRRDSSWDTSSFSKKMLGRSSSVATRNSATSSFYRKSMTFNGEVKNPSSDRIINWRNSIVSSKDDNASTSTTETVSGINKRFSFNDRDRSVSPGKRTTSLSHRFSLRHGPTPLANSSSPVSTSNSQQPSGSGSPRPETAIRKQASSPTQSHHNSSIPQVPGISINPSSPDPSASTPITPPANKHSLQTSLPKSFAAAHTGEENDLFLVGDQSYMAWNVQNTLIPMANGPLRTPGPDSLGNGRDPLSRGGSFVSELSSERLSVVSPAITNGPDAGLGQESRRESVVSAISATDGEELRCKKCGGERFKMMRGESGRTVLRCRKCGEEVLG